MLNQIKEISPKKRLTVPDKKWVGIKFLKARKERLPLFSCTYMYYTKGKKLFKLLMK